MKAQKWWEFSDHAVGNINMKENKTWTVGRGIGIGLISISIAIVLSFLIVVTENEVDKYRYSNCLKNGYNSDVCMPLINDNYYPDRYSYPMPPEKQIPILNETDIK